MKKIFYTLLCLFVSIGAFAQEGTKKVFGTITDDFGPLKNVNIVINDAENGTTSDEQGKYALQVKEGDVLTFSYVGMKTQSIKIEDVTRILNVRMYYEVEELDNVTISKNILKSQRELQLEYENNPNIIKSIFGYLDKETTSYSLRLLDQEEINPGGLDLALVLRNRFAGVNVVCDVNNILRVTTRPINSLSIAGGAIFDVDGQILENIPCDLIDPQNIRRMAVISSFSGVGRYGQIGRGGVVIINTKSGTQTLTNDDGTPYDRARLRDNFIYKKPLDRASIAQNEPTYLKKLKASSSLEDAREVYREQAKTFKSSPYFLLDSYRYFTEYRNDTEFANNILDDNKYVLSGNPVLLKGLAYIHEEQGRFEKANEVYKDVFILRPNYAQSYLDMFKSYRDIREPKQAAAMYARYNYLLEERFLEPDSIGFGPIMEREFNNLLTLNKNALVEGRKASKLFVAEEDFRGTRLVFEWNDSEAEFELQFVNPEKQYLLYKHTMHDNPQMIQREKDYGYGTTEYLIDGALPGTWQVNVNYLGNKSLTPTYLKATVYYNYGSRSQSKEVKLFKLALKNVNQELFKLAANGSMVLK